MTQDEDFEYMMLTYMATDYIVNKYYNKDATSKGLKVFQMLTKEQKVQTFTTEKMLDTLLRYFNPYLIINDKIAIHAALDDENDPVIVQKLLSTCDTRLNECQEKYALVDMLLLSSDDNSIKKLFELGLRLEDGKDLDNLIEMALVNGSLTLIKALKDYQNYDLDRKIRNETFTEIIMEQLSVETSTRTIQELETLLLYLKEQQAEKMAHHLDSSLSQKPVTKNFKI